MISTWIGFHILCVLLGCVLWTRNSHEVNVYITPFSKNFYYKDGDQVLFLCQTDTFMKYDSRWLFLYPDDDNFDAVESNGYYVFLKLYAADNGSRLLCYHRDEIGPPYLNYSDVVTFVTDESPPPAE